MLDVVERTEIKEKDVIYIKLNKKDPTTKSYIWPATIIALGHKSFVDNAALNVSMQMTNANGEIGFFPVVESQDPDLTVHENVNQVILNNATSSQNTKMRTNQELTASPAISEILDESDIPQEILNASMPSSQAAGVADSAYPALCPQEVSRELNEIELNVDEQQLDYGDDGDNEKVFSSSSSGISSSNSSISGSSSKVVVVVPDCCTRKRKLIAARNQGLVKRRLCHRRRETVKRDGQNLLDPMKSLDLRQRRLTFEHLRL